MDLMEKVEQGLAQIKEQKDKEVSISLDYFDLLQIRKGIKLNDQIHLLLRETVKEQNDYRRLMRDTE